MMKKMLWICSGLLLAATACTGERIAPDQPTAPDIPDGYRLETVQAGYPTRTRTEFDNETGSFSWSEGDRLAFHLTDGTYTVSTVDPETGKVQLLIKDGLSRNEYAVYPADAVVEEDNLLNIKYPSTYDISGDLQSDYAPTPMVADNDPTLQKIAFNHVGALLQINLHVPEGAREVRVSLGKRITGTFRLSESEDGLPEVRTDGEAEDEVVFILSPDGLPEDTDVRLLLPIPTGSYHALTLTVSNGTTDTDRFEKEVSFDFLRGAGKKISIKASSLEDNRDYFWIEALEAGSTVSLSEGADAQVRLFVSTDGKKTFQEWDKTELTLEHVGDRAYFYGTTGTFTTGYSGSKVTTFRGTGRLKTGGPVRTLLHRDGGTVQSYTFHSLFYLNKALIDASELILPAETAPNSYDDMFGYCSNLQHGPAVLPALHMSERCYQMMFGYCTSLQETPPLPAMDLAEECYKAMFSSCTSLTEPPVLPAEQLAKGCYEDMFRLCTALKVAPVLHAMNLAPSCYTSMLRSCHALTECPALPAEILFPSCYSCLFEDCTGITAPPLLPAQKMESRCYFAMFRSCTGLATPPVLSSTQLASYCYFDMLRNTAITTAPELPATLMAESCYEGMFSWCKNLKSGPALPSVSLAVRCYADMFECSALTTPPALPATTLASGCYSGMFLSCSSLATMPDLPAETIVNRCYYQMFKECSALKEACVPAKNYTGNAGCQGMFFHCTRLQKITLGVTQWNSSTFKDWVSYVASTGQFCKSEALETVYGNDAIPTGWEVYNVEDISAQL